MNIDEWANWASVIGVIVSVAGFAVAQVQPATNPASWRDGSIRAQIESAMNKYFYDVPVYRVSQGEYDRQIQNFVQPYVDAAKSIIQRDPSYEIGLRQGWRDYFGGSWQFNEIIGFIRLKFFGTQIRGEWWTVRARRITKTRKKQFEYRTHKLAPETDIPSGASNDQIWDLILEHLNDCRRELRRRYVDSRLLEVIGPHVNWRAFIEGNSRPNE